MAKRLSPLVFGLIILLMTPGINRAAPHDVTITVNTLVDDDNLNGNCSLREAMQAANTNAPVDACSAGSSSSMDTINFSVNGTIAATTYLPFVENAGPLTINGGNQVTVSGYGSTFLFYVHYGADLTLRNLTIRDAYISASHPTVMNGAGLENNGGTVIIDNCWFHHNIVNPDVPDTKGGAIYNHNEGSLTIDNSRFSENEAFLGSAIYSESNALNINSTSFSKNSASDSGSGLYNLGNAQVNSTTFAGNVAQKYGGAIYSSGNLTVSNSSFDGNQVFGTGGALMCSYGTCTIDTSRFANNIVLGGSGGAICSYANKLYVSGSFFGTNAVTDYGGAIHLWKSPDFSIVASTFDDNSADQGGGVMAHQALGSISDSLFRSNYGNQGGGIFYEANDITSSGMTVERTTFWENEGKTGGAIVNDNAQLTMVNDTLAFNTADQGAGVYNKTGGKVMIYHSTLAHNSAISPGDQVYNQPGGEVYVVSSILSYGGSGQNCYGTITDEGMNIDSGNTCSLYTNRGSFPDTDPLLGPLQDNGGEGVPDYPTLTFALQNLSPAINHSQPDYSDGTDQRGYPRRHNFSDIGAYEAQPHIFNKVQGDGQSTRVLTYFPQELVMEAQDEYGNRLAGVFVRFHGPFSGPSIINNLFDTSTNENGYGSFRPMANNLAGGPYEVYVVHSIGTVSTTFHLTNIAAPGKSIFLPMMVK